MEGKKFAGGVVSLLIAMLAIMLAGCTIPTAQVVKENGSSEICTPNMTLVPDEQVVQENVKEEKYPGYMKKTYVEGDKVSLKVRTSDSDDDKVFVKYSKPLDSDGEWQTKVGDAGEYLITIVATDGKANTTKEVVLVIEPQNHPPVMKKINDFTVAEGDTINFLPEVSDQDKDPITITYSGWMTTPSYQVKFGDAGKHTVTVTASDGKAQVSQSVGVTVRKGNRAPELKDIEPITITEGGEIAVKPVASDPDGDEITFSFSAPLDRRGRWEKTLDAAGTYTATVTASDGKANTTKSVSIVVLSKNNPPTIEQPDLIVNIGDTVRLNPTVTDKDGDATQVTFSGWMDGPARVTTEDDAGTHLVTITATDGVATTSLNVKIHVNTPPKLIFE
jgi:hypothetical protein